MANVLSSATSVLLYGMLLTTIFHHFDLDLDGESDIRVCKPFDAIDNGSISRLRYELHRHEWVLKTTHVPIADEEESNEEAAMNIPLPSPAAALSPPPSTTGAKASSTPVDWYQNLSQHLVTISLDIQQLRLDHQEDMNSLFEEQDRHFRELFA